MKKYKLEVTITMVESEITDASIKALKESIESGELQKQAINKNDDIISCEATFTEL